MTHDDFDGECPTCGQPFLRAKLQEAEMQRDVFCEKLNEYIDKTKEAEKRAEAAEQELALCREASAASIRDGFKAIEQARAEGYERGKREARICEGCGCTLTCDC